MFKLIFLTLKNDLTRQIAIHPSIFQHFHLPYFTLEHSVCNKIFFFQFEQTLLNFVCDAR
jgi:hypothetical protein